MVNDTQSLNPKEPEQLTTQTQELFQSIDSTFPSPIQDLVMGYLDGDVALSKQMSYGANLVCTLFECGNKEKPYDKLAFAALLGHVVRAEQDQAEAIIRTNPEFLFKLGTVKDLAGNTFIQYSPIQLACYGCDAGMLRMMKIYLDDRGKMQFNEIVTEAIEELNIHQPYDFSSIVFAITSGNAEQKEQDLALFRKQFEPREIKNEKSFNIETLRKAYEIYIKYYYPWTSEECSSFWCEVIGYYQRSLPACYAQAFCQGLHHVTDGHQSLKRELVLSGGEPFYPEDLNKQAGLGYDFGIISNTHSSRDYGCRTWVPHPDGWKRVEISGGLLQKYIEKSKQALRSMCDDMIIKKELTLS